MLVLIQAMMIGNYFYQPFPVLDLIDIVLRELTILDAEDYFSYMSRPEMLEYITKTNMPASLKQAQAEIKYWASLFDQKKSFYWAIATKNTNQLLGTVGFNIITVNHLKAEISYDLDSNFWGQGIMPRAVAAVLELADQTLKLVRIQATVNIDNQRSIKLLQRCNFQQEGLLRKYEIVNKRSKDYLIFARLANC